MGKTFIVFCLAGLLILSSGCFFASYTPVSDFALDLKPVPGNGKVCVSVLRNASGSGMRIQSRSYSELNRDPYNVWAMEPGQLVTTALNKILCKDGVPPRITLYGEIDCFEADIPEKVFRISGFYADKNDRKKIRFDITAPLPGNTPGNIALAASEAVQKLAVRLAKTAE